MYDIEIQISNVYDIEIQTSNVNDPSYDHYPVDIQGHPSSLQSVCPLGHYSSTKSENSVHVWINLVSRLQSWWTDMRLTIVTRGHSI